MQRLSWFREAPIRRTFLQSVALLLSVVATGTLGFVLIEGWSFVDALWMVVITLTTVGFGEVHPLSAQGRLFTMGLIVAGVSTGAYAMGSLTRMAVEGQLRAMLRDQRRRRQMKDLKDHFIVVGYGRLGQAIIQELLAAGVPVCVVELSPDKAAQAEALQRFPVIQGDGASDEILRWAGIERARGIAIAVDQSAQAVFVTLSARELNPNLTIVTRVDDVGVAQKARRAGASSIVSPHDMGGWRIAHELIRPHATSFLDVLTLSSYAEIQLEEFPVGAHSRSLDRTLADLDIGVRTGALIVAIRRQDGKMLPAPRAAERVREGDVLIAIGSPEAIRKMRAAIGD